MGRISTVPLILEVISRTTGMGFAAVPTPSCAVAMPGPMATRPVSVHAHNGDTFLLAVANDGEPIPPTTIQRMFRRF